MNKFVGLDDLTISASIATPWLPRPNIISSILFESFFICMFKNIAKFNFMICRETWVSKTVL
jgi:hypothetical protein